MSEVFAWGCVCMLRMRICWRYKYRWEAVMAMIGMQGKGVQQEVCMGCIYQVIASHFIIP